MTGGAQDGGAFQDDSDLGPVGDVASAEWRWTTRDGVTLAGDVQGPVDGQPVVLLHGGGQTRHSWRSTGAILSALGYRVVTFDARGHGESSWSTTRTYGVDAFASDLVTIATTLGLADPVLVGASIGGDTSLVAAGELGLGVSAVVLVDVLPHADPTGVNRVVEFMRASPDGFDTLEAMADAVAQYQPHRRREKNTATLTKNARRGPDGRFRWHFDPSFAQVDLDLRERRERLDRVIVNIDAPLLLIRGLLSDVLTDESVAAFRALRPDAECVSVRDAAHMVAGDQNDIFTDAVTEFLRRTSPPQRVL